MAISITQPKLEAKSKDTRVEHNFLSSVHFGKKVSRKELILFTTQLSLMLGTGYSLNRALEVIGPQIQHPYFREIISKVLEEIESGKLFSEALENYHKSFSPLFIINQVASRNMGFKLFSHIEKTANEQINTDESRFRIAPEYLGSMEYDKKNVRHSEAKKSPLLAHAPHLKLSQSLLHMASRFHQSGEQYDPRIKYKHPLKRFMAVLTQKG